MPRVTPPAPGASETRSSGHAPARIDRARARAETERCDPRDLRPALMPILGLDSACLERLVERLRDGRLRPCTQVAVEHASHPAHAAFTRDRAAAEALARARTPDPQPAAAAGRG
jgi:hypothetical protein